MPHKAGVGTLDVDAVRNVVGHCSTFIFKRGLLYRHRILHLHVMDVGRHMEVT